MRRAQAPQGLWRHPDFLRLWAGQTISQFGSQVTLLALPLTAALALGATPAEMGILAALQSAPFLLVGLLAGVWVDRLPRRPVLIVADLGRAALLGSLPAAAFLDRLGMPQLYLVAFATGLLSVFFDVAYGAYLPALVREDALVDSNSKLELTNSAARVAGPGLTGVLVQVLTAPIALLVDAVSFLLSALSLALIRATEPPPAPRAGRPSLRAEVGTGLRLVFGNPLLRAIAGCTATANLAWNVIFAVFILYATRQLGLTPALLGLIAAAGNVGFLVGAGLAGPLARRLGLGPTLVAMPVLGSLGALLIGAAGGSRPVAAACLIGAQFLFGFGGVIYNINQVSLRQALTPDRLRGRMTATMRFLVWGTIPLGALLGGLLGERLGLRPTLLVGALGTLTAFLWVACSPVRALRAQPTGPIDLGGVAADPTG